MPEVFSPPQEPVLAYDEPRAWPKVIGVISIVFAALGLLCNGCTPFIGPLTLGMMPPEFTKPPLPPKMSPGVLMYALAGIGFFAGVLLLVAGISLVSRKRSGRGLHLAWGVIACLICLAAIYVQWQVSIEMKDFYQQNPDSPWTQQAKASPVGPETEFLIAAVSILVFGMAYPVFCLVWFGLIKRNPAEIDAGVDRSVV